MPIIAWARDADSSEDEAVLVAAIKRVRDESGDPDMTTVKVVVALQEDEEFRTVSLARVKAAEKKLLDLIRDGTLDDYLRAGNGVEEG